MKTLPLWSAVIALLICAMAPIQNVRAATADELRAEAKELMQKARELKASERYEESEKLAREARQLEGEARDLSNEGGPRRPGPDDVVDHLEHRRGQFQQPERPDRPDAAAPRRQEFREMERSVPPRERRPSRDVENRERPRHDGDGEQGPGSERFGGPDGPPRSPGGFDDRRQPGLAQGQFRPDGAERPQRLQHLQQAIEHLHAAGWHEMAERLEREAVGFQREGGRARDLRPATPTPGLREPPGAFREIESNLAEMRRQMNEMRRALEQMREMIQRRGGDER